MEKLVAGDLNIEPTHAGAEAPIRLTWRGKSTERNPAAILRPYFATILAEATAQKAKIEMHFEDLEHLNSSTISSIIQMIQDAREKAVRLVIVCDPTRKWQKLSFDALRVFVTGDEMLEISSVQR